MCDNTFGQIQTACDCCVKPESAKKSAAWVERCLDERGGQRGIFARMRGPLPFGLWAGIWHLPYSLEIFRQGREKMFGSEALEVGVGANFYGACSWA